MTTIYTVIFDEGDCVEVVKSFLNKTDVENYLIKNYLRHRDSLGFISGKCFSCQKKISLINISYNCQKCDKTSCLECKTIECKCSVKCNDVGCKCMNEYVYLRKNHQTQINKIIKNMCTYENGIGYRYEKNKLY